MTGNSALTIAASVIIPIGLRPVPVVGHAAHNLEDALLRASEQCRCVLRVQEANVTCCCSRYSSKLKVRQV
jgi:hypothetical protein